MFWLLTTLVELLILYVIAVCVVMSYYTWAKRDPLLPPFARAFCRPGIAICLAVAGWMQRLFGRR